MTEAQIAFVESIKKIVDERISSSPPIISDRVIEETVENYMHDVDLSDHVERAVDRYLSYNLDVNDVVRDAVENHLDDSTVTEHLGDYLESNKDLIADYFRTDDGKRLIKDVFADLIRGA